MYKINNLLYPLTIISNEGDKQNTRNFPNELDSKKKYGTYIYCIESNVKLGHLDNKQSLDKLVNLDTEKYEQQIGELLIEEVKYHEFGHNLFKNGFPSSFEETKATFYYFLYLRENKDKFDTIPLILSALELMYKEAEILNIKCDS